MFRKIWPLLLICALAFSLRVYSLDKVPPALFGDEIDVGDQAYSLLKTGRDINNRFLPVYIKSVAEYRAPLYIYSAVPFVAVFGLNEWGVRLPAAFWGVVSILGLYLLAERLFSKKIALASALIVAFSPWHLQYSRGGFEATMLLAFLIFATYFFLLGIRKGIFLLISLFLFGLTPYIYSTAVLFTPLWLLALTMLFWNEVVGKTRQTKSLRFPAAALLILGLTVLPALWSIHAGVAGERFSVVSIFKESVLLDKINLARRGEEFFTVDGIKTQINPAGEYFFHNKLSVYSQVFALNYLRAFSPEFLFTRGDPTFRQSIQEMGELYYFEIPLILLGLWFLLTRVNSRLKYFILGWLLLSPLPAALTADGGFHATRLFLMIPPLEVLSALGVVFLLSRWKNWRFKIFGSALVVLALFNIIFYFHRYYIHYPVESWRWWQIGYKEALTFINQNQFRYDKIIINNSYEPSLERFLFYTRYDPAKFHREFSGDKMRDNILPGIDGFALNDKIYFGKINDQAKKDGGFEKVMKPGMLYMASPSDEGGDMRTFGGGRYNILKTVMSPVVDPGTPDGQPIFLILEGK